MNWPMKVVPAVCAGLLGLLALRAGFVIRATGPPALGLLGSNISESRASIGPPGLPMSSMAALTTSVAGANGSSIGKIRPNAPGNAGMPEAEESASTPNRSPIRSATAPAAPAPSVPRKRRRVNRGISLNSPSMTPTPLGRFDDALRPFPPTERQPELAPPWKVRESGTRWYRLLAAGSADVLRLQNIRAGFAGTASDVKREVA